jgi:hypothetical protein
MAGSYWASALVHKDAIYWGYTGEIMNQSFVQWRPSEPNTYDINKERTARVKYQLGSVKWLTTIIDREESSNFTSEAVFRLASLCSNVCTSTSK